MHLLIQELQLLKGACLRVLGTFVVLAGGFLATPVAQQALERMHADLVPNGVALVGLTPLDPFVAQATVAAVLALLVALPLLLFELWRYIAPGLYPAERRALGGVVLAGVALFAFGAWFAYQVIIPATFAGLYAFTPDGLPAFYSLRDLVSLVCGMTLAVALLFELPVAMVGLARLGLVDPGFWARHARAAVLLALVASAILTPDGSGISMVLLAAPIGVLYGAGWAASTVAARQSALQVKYNI